MKRSMVLAALVAMPFSSMQAAEYVSGHMRSDGTYVQGYYRSEANSTKLDNYSSQGNINPYTGEIGTRSIYDAGATQGKSRQNSWEDLR